MSDIAGPPAPKNVQSNVKGTDKSARVTKDPQDTGARTQDHKNPERAPQQNTAHHARDPAVSIASTAAHVRVGQELQATVSSFDSEGRPIIVTETATFALKPDAGLKPEDAVTLKIVETGKNIAAELLVRNTHVINPPIRLALIVTEIHGPSTSIDASVHISSASLSQPYKPPLRAAQPLTANSLAAVLPTTVNAQSTIEEHQNHSHARPAVSGSSHSTVLSPAPDTAAQNANPPGSPARPVQAENPPQQVQQTVNAPQTPQLGITGEGIGPAITAVSSGGARAVIQLLDPAISSVSPRELATVTQVTPLTASNAIALEAGGNLLRTFGGNTALSTVETNRGVFVAPSEQVTHLTGELVRLAISTPPGDSVASNTQQPPNQPSNALSALLIENNDGARPQKIQVIFNKTATTSTENANADTATIKTVKTLAAFIGQNGPKTDLRLETTRGDISLTIPSGQRPSVGDTLQIRWPEAQILPAVTLGALASTPQPETITPPPEVSPTNALATQAATNTAPNLLTNWPALQESIAAIAASSNPAVVSLLADKSAQGGGKLTNSLLFFLAAAGRGSAAAWLGQKAEQALQSTHPSLLNQLQSDVRQMATMANDRSGEWRAIMVPLDARAGDVPLAALLVQQQAQVDPDGRNHKDTAGQKDKDAEKRFILQVQFSVLGDIQLDGRVNTQKFDLTVRSAAHFGTALQQDLRDLFEAALSANGYVGALRFERQHPFNIDAQTIVENKLFP